MSFLFSSNKYTYKTAYMCTGEPKTMSAREFSHPQMRQMKNPISSKTKYSIVRVGCVAGFIHVPPYYPISHAIHWFLFIWMRHSGFILCLSISFRLFFFSLLYLPFASFVPFIESKTIPGRFWATGKLFRVLHFARPLSNDYYWLIINTTSSLVQHFSIYNCFDYESETLVNSQRERTNSNQ